MEVEKVIKGKEHADDVPDGKPTQRHQCGACKACFDTTQALGGYRHNRKVVKADCAAQERVELLKNAIVDEFAIVATGKHKQKVNVKPKVRGATLSVSDDSSSAAKSTSDGRKINRGSSIRKNTHQH